MKSSNSRSLLALGSILVIVVLSLSFLNGCGSAAGGGGGGGAAAPGNHGISTTTTLSGVALVPNGTSSACKPGFFPMIARFFVSGAWALAGHTPVAGATVKAYNFYTGSLMKQLSQTQTAITRSQAFQWASIY